MTGTALLSSTFLLVKAVVAHQLGPKDYLLCLLFVGYHVATAYYVESRLAFRNVRPHMALYIWAPVAASAALLWPSTLLASAEPFYKFLKNVKSNVKYSRYEDIAEMGWRELARSAFFTALLAVVYNITIIKGKPRVPMRGLAVLLVAVAIHMIGFGMVIPVMPFLLRELGGDAAAQGFLVSLFSLFQLLSAPLWGALADRLGKTRIVVSGLLLSALGNAAAYFSNSLFSLAVARAVAGLGGGTIGALQALVADLSPPERRASSMALFGMAFGAGFVLGPVLGGVAGSIAPRLPFLLAAAMSVAAAAVVTRIPVVRGRVQWTFKLELGLLSLAVLLLNFSFSMFEGLVSYYGADVFQMTPSQIGVLMLVVGVAAMAGQMAVRRLEGRLASGTAAAVGVAITSIGLALLAAGELPLLYLGAALASIGQLIAASNLFAIASSIGGAGGTSFGILQSAGSLGRLVGPAAAGLIYTHLGPPYVFLTSALVALSIVPIALRHLATHQ